MWSSVCNNGIAVAGSAFVWSGWVNDAAGNLPLSNSAKVLALLIAQTLGRQRRLATAKVAAHTTAKRLGGNKLCLKLVRE